MAKRMTNQATEQTEPIEPIPFVGATPEQAAAARAKRRTRGKLQATKKRLEAEPKVKILIHERLDGIIEPPVTVCINGYTYQIQRGKEVEVPTSVFELLATSKIPVAREVRDEFGNRRTKIEKVPRFPMSRV